MKNHSYSALIVAAGRGERAGGGLPKQFRALGGQPMLAWSIERFKADPACQQVIVVVASGVAAEARKRLGHRADGCRFVTGGTTRTQSVANGLQVITQPRVLIHDAARPLLSSDLILRLNEALQTHDGAAPALAVADALVRLDDNAFESVSRDGLFRVQTPQAFHTQLIQSAFEAFGFETFPDEVSLARAADLDVALIPGEEANFKVTWPEDFARAEPLLPGSQKSSLSVTGMGYDVHRLVPGDGIHLCGVFIPCPLHLVGHSDADAGLHAITDALLGAAGLGDIGDHFPPSDDRWKGADSAQFLEHAVNVAQQAGALVRHADVTLICERPKIGPHKAAMKTIVAGILGLDPDRVNIKATTTEKLGFTGRGEGLAAEAVVTCEVAAS